jgi:hypothetical protein
MLCRKTKSQARPKYVPIEDANNKNMLKPNSYFPFKKSSLDQNFTKTLSEKSMQQVNRPKTITESAITEASSLKLLTKEVKCNRRTSVTNSMLIPTKTIPKIQSEMDNTK